MEVDSAHHCGELKEMGNSVSNSSYHCLMFHKFAKLTSLFRLYYLIPKIETRGVYVCFVLFVWFWVLMKQGSQAESLSPFKKSLIPLPFGNFESQFKYFMYDTIFLENHLCEAYTLQSACLV